MEFYRTVKAVIIVRLACNRHKITYRSPLLATVVIGDAPVSIGEYERRFWSYVIKASVLNV